jgi:GT2 family glycosyltransferase
VDKSQFKWIIICNNDVTFNDPQFFSHLNEMDIENYPIIGPKIQSSVSKKDLNPFLSNSISTIQDLYYSLYYSNTDTAKFVHAMGSIINRKLMHRNLAEGKGEGGPKIKQIYAPHGSCIIFSSTFFKKGGYLDTGFTIYGEEISTAEIAQSLNMSIYYIPMLSIIHNDHQSTTLSSWKENFHHSKKTYYYLKEKYRS